MHRISIFFQKIFPHIVRPSVRGRNLKRLGMWPIFVDCLSANGEISWCPSAEQVHCTQDYLSELKLVFFLEILKFIISFS